MLEVVAEVLVAMAVLVVKVVLAGIPDRHKLLELMVHRVSAVVVVVEQAKIKLII
jgi:hypothetical protein